MMRNISLVFILLVLNLTVTAQATTRPAAVSQSASQSAEGACTAALAKLEIAGLILDRSALNTTQDAALRTLIDKNLQQKIEDYRLAFGVAPDAREISALIQQIETEKAEKLTTKNKQVRKIRRREANVFKTGELFTKNFGVKLPLTDTIFDMGEFIKGQGVQWSDDEKYVIFRNIYEESWLYNTAKRSFLRYKPKAGGVMSAQGHLFAEYDQGQTTVVNLDTGEKFGPFEGEPVRRDFNEDFILTRSQLNSKGFKQSVWRYTLRHFKTNRNIEIGYTHSFSPDMKTVAFVNDEPTIEIVDLKTGRHLDRFKADLRPQPIVFRVDGMIAYYKNGKPTMKRLSDLQEFDLPYGEPQYFSADEQKVFFKGIKSKSGQFASVIYDVVTKKKTPFTGYVDLAINSNKTQAVFYSHGSNKGTVLVDLNTMATQTLPAEYRRFSPNGRWLYDETANGFHTMYDLQTGQTRSFQGGDDFNFFGMTNKTIAKSGDAIYTSDLTNWNGSPFAVEVGKTAGRASPSGRFMMTYNAGGELKLSAVGP